MVMASIPTREASFIRASCRGTKTALYFFTDFQNLTGHLRKKRHPGDVALRPWEDKRFQNKELPCRWWRSCVLYCREITDQYFISHRKFLHESLLLLGSTAGVHHDTNIIDSDKNSDNIRITGSYPAINIVEKLLEGKPSIPLFSMEKCLPAACSRTESCFTYPLPSGSGEKRRPQSVILSPRHRRWVMAIPSFLCFDSSTNNHRGQAWEIPENG